MGSRRDLRLLIVQPYLAQYRVAFYDRLVPRLAADGVVTRVTSAAAPDSHTLRRDVAEQRSYVVATRRRGLPVGRGAQLTYLGGAALIREADLVIVPAAATIADSHLALFGPGRRRRRVGFWGHLDAYMQPPSALDRRIEGVMMRRADHVLAYTDKGRQFAIDQGVDPGRATALHNTIDTDGLAAARDALSPSDVAAWRDARGLHAHRVFAYIGGIDEQKNFRLVVGVLDEMFERHGREVQFVIGGRGESESLLQRSIARGQSVHLGYVGNRDKALMAAVSQALLCPGPIGLVAVDALALGLPLITTEGQRHAPEVEYLREGDSLFTVGATTSAYADCLTSFEPKPLTTPAPPLSDMVDRYRAAVALLASDLCHRSVP